MSQTRNIQIIYHNDPMDPDDQVYTYQITLGPDDGSNQNYFTGQEQAVQMQGLANALNSALPQKSVIVSVNGHDFKVIPKQDFINMLIRKDDYVSVVLFGTGNNAMEQTPIKKQNPNNEPAVTPTKSTPVQSNESQEHQDATETKMAKDYAYPRIIEYQPNGKGRYKPLNLNTGDTPNPTDKIKQIGMSELGTPIYWKDLEKILDKESNTLFNNPLGVIPANGSITSRRRQTFAKLSGLEKNALDNFETRVLTMFSDDNGDNGKSMYKLVVLTDTAQTQENKNQTEESNDYNSKLLEKAHWNNIKLLEKVLWLMMNLNGVKDEKLRQQDILKAGKLLAKVGLIKETNDTHAITSFYNNHMRNFLIKYYSSVGNHTDEVTNEATNIVNKSDDVSSLEDQSVEQAASTLANAMENYQVAVKKQITKLEETNAKLSNLDTTGLPEEIIKQINSNTASKDKAAYLFNLINSMSTGQISKDSALGSLYNPDVFLKAVNALSWRQSI